MESIEKLQKTMAKYDLNLNFSSEVVIFFINIISRITNETLQLGTTKPVHTKKSP